MCIYIYIVYVYRMLVFPVFEFFLVACATGLSRALSVPSGVSDNHLEVSASTSIPNHIPEDNFNSMLTTTPGDISRTSVVSTTGGSPTRTSATTPPAPPATPVAATTPAPPAPPASSSSSQLNVSTTGSTPTDHHNMTTRDSTTTVTTNTTHISTTTTTSTTTSTPDLTTSKGLQCNCSTDGSVDPASCDPLTGNCTCLQGYSGLRCDRCSSGYFENHTGGCRPCDCDSSGAAGQQCDSSGVCQCKAGAYGDKCDDCRPGFFKFSSTGCQACQCNNHSNTCDKQSGICLHCQGNTGGPSCGECKPNFYRERGSSPSKSCLPCPCSSVTSSGSCTLDVAGRPVCDQCNSEYKGANCERCRDGYYNSDSICVPCDCNENAEPSSTSRICDPDSGHCLNCSFNTSGTHCQHCAPGFIGDAIAKNCTAIVPTTPVYSSTMTPRPNVTDQLPTSSTALLSTLTSPAANGTSSPEPVSWAQFNVIVLVVIITLILALLGAAGGIYTYRQYQNRKINAPFWTIELKEDNISFSSYHDSLTNVDASGLLDDEACEAASNGQLTLNSPGSLYMP